MPLTFGSGAYIEQLGSNVENLSPTVEAAVGVWFRRSGTPSGNPMFVFSKCSFVIQGFGLYLLTSSQGADAGKVGLFAADRNSAAQAVDVRATSTNAFDGNWHLLSANLRFANGATNEVYSDGGSKGSQNASRVWDITDHPIRLNTTNGTFFQGFDGSLAHGFFYREALTDAEHYALAAGVSPLLIRPHALSAYYPMAAQDPFANLIKVRHQDMAEVTTSGTITAADTFIPQESDMIPIDDLWFSVPVAGPSRHAHYNPIRSARRK